MSLKSDLIALLNSMFGNELHFGTFPDGFRPSAPACVAQGIGGTPRVYVDQTQCEVEHRRVQFYVWGERVLDVEDAMATLKAMLLNTINDPLTNFVGVEVMSEPTDDYDDVLKLHGARQDFGIHWKNPVSP